MPLSDLPPRPELETLDRDEVVQGMVKGKDGPDVTHSRTTQTLSAHVRFFRDVSWTNTPLGPMSHWSQDLRTMCDMIMASPHPAAIYWGSEYIAIYNEAYVRLIGDKHPSLMGQSCRDGRKEGWEGVSVLLAEVALSAQASVKHDDLILTNRNDFLEETYFSWSMIPITGISGRVVGVHNHAFETTHQVITAQRMSMLQTLMEKTWSSSSVSAFWVSLAEGFSHRESDIPLVLLYSSSPLSGNDGSPPDTDSKLGSHQYHFQSASGVSLGHPIAPRIIDLDQNSEIFTDGFRRAATSRGPVVVREESGNLNLAPLEDVRWQGSGIVTRTFVVLPIFASAQKWPSGFIVVGTNPRRPYDESYRVFLDTLVRQISASLTTVVLFEQELRATRTAVKLAAQDQILLSRQLAVRTQEARGIEKKFMQMAELTPVGIFMAEVTGHITYCNEAWYRLSSYPRERRSVGNDWFEQVHDEDRAVLQRSWSTMLKSRTPLCLEFRFNVSPSERPSAGSNHVWILANVHPDQDELGNFGTFFGSFTDITAQKEAECVQRRRANEVSEWKKQQEAFMDMTNHEIRNPLSAILQCADEITASLTDIAKCASLVLEKPLWSSIDAAETIILCAQHQKRIVDDLLTLSQMDSVMLVVTPIDANFASVVRQTMRIFRPEIRAAGITLRLHVHNSIHALGLDMVRLDPARLTQVMINLINNAVKFTKNAKQRTINIDIAATTTSSPPAAFPSLDFVKQPPNLCHPSEFDAGDVYLHFVVQDPGRGFLPSEGDRLFERLSPANLHTQIENGGSRLGLFVAKLLVELQGGAIGFRPREPRGSAFGFYIQARRPERSRVARITSVIVPEFPGHDMAEKVELPEEDAWLQMTILIVEDNVVDQKVLAREFERHGHRTMVADHGAEALAILRSSTYWRQNLELLAASSPIDISAVLLDLEMPVMDGLACARTIRALQASNDIIGHVPLIVVTGNARQEHVERARRAGADCVVTKPFTVAELMPKIMQTCRKCRIKDRVGI